MNPIPSRLPAPTRLLNYRVFFCGEIETLRKEAFIQFTQAGLGSVFEADADVASLQGVSVDESVLILESENPEHLSDQVSRVMEEGFRAEQLILLGSPHALVPRILARSLGCEVASYSIKKTPVGPEIRLEDLVSASEKCVDRALFPIFDQELEQIRKNGLLFLIEKFTGTPSARIVERAVFTHQIATRLALRPGDVRKAVRLSFYLDVASQQNWKAGFETLLGSAKNLWNVADGFKRLSATWGGEVEWSRASLYEAAVWAATQQEKLSQAWSQGIFEQDSVWSKIPLEQRVALKMAIRQTIESLAPVQTAEAMGRLVG